MRYNLRYPEPRGLTGCLSMISFMDICGRQSVFMLQSVSTFIFGVLPVWFLIKEYDKMSINRGRIESLYPGCDPMEKLRQVDPQGGLDAPAILASY